MQGVMTYHSVDDSGSVISLAPAQFRRHVEWLARSAVSVRPLAEMVSTTGANTSAVVVNPSTRNAIALTFDDGFANFADVALPLLRAHAMPATVFVVTDHVGGDNRWGGRASANIPVLPLMDWDALGTLAEYGVEIGAHTRSHPHLPTRSDAQLQDELHGCAELLAQRTGRRPTSFAYPYGALDARSAQHAGAVFTVACTTELRALRPHEDRTRIPRLDAWYFREPGQLESWGSVSMLCRLALRRAGRRVRRLMVADGGQ